MRGAPSRWLAAVTLVIAATACDMVMKEPAPTDEALIERFRASRERFEVLRRNPGDAALRESLGILEVRDLSHDTEEIRFVVWTIDFPGPGGAARGYAWREREPRELVESLDATRSCEGPGLVDLHRPIEDRWYLYCSAAD